MNTVLTGLALTDPRADLLIQPCSAQREVTGPHTELSEEKLRGLRLTKSGHSPQSLQSRHGYSDPERKGSREAELSRDHQAVPPNLADGSCLGSELLRSVSQMSRVEVWYSRASRWDCPDFTHDEGEWSMDHAGNARGE